MRKVIDKILQHGIKLCMLTGVAFTFASCYGPAPERNWQNEPDYREAQRRMEQQLRTAADGVSVADRTSAADGISAADGVSDSELPVSRTEP